MSDRNITQAFWVHPGMIKSDAPRSVDAFGGVRDGDIVRDSGAVLFFHMVELRTFNLSLAERRVATSGYVIMKAAKMQPGISRTPGLLRASKSLPLTPPWGTVQGRCVRRHVQVRMGQPGCPRVQYLLNSVFDSRSLTSIVDSRLSLSVQFCLP